MRDPIRTAAALYATPLGKVLVYGTVMPWSSDRGLTGAAPYWAEHHRVVPEQVRGVERTARCVTVMRRFVSQATST